MGVQRIVPVIGTGTLGEPVIRLLRNLQQFCSIDVGTVHKNRPLLQERRRIINLMRRGAKRAVETEKTAEFPPCGMQPLSTCQEDLAQAIAGRFLYLRRAIEFRIPYVFNAV